MRYTACALIVGVALAAPALAAAPTQLSAAPDTTFVVTVDANPSTGYQWKLTTRPNPAVAVYVSRRYRSNTPNPPPGAGGVQTWTFRAQAAGTTTFRLSLFPPARGAKAAQVRTYRVVVR